MTQAQVLLNLGREDKLDPDGPRRLVASINRYLGEPGGIDDVREAVGDALTVTDARPIGAVWLLDGLWHQLDVDRALRQVLRESQVTTHVEGCCSRWSGTGRSTRGRSRLGRVGHVRRRDPRPEQHG